MRRFSLTVRRMLLALSCTFVASLVVTAGAQAVVVDMNPAAAGQASVTYPSDQSDYYGVALSPEQVGASSWVPGSATSMLSSAGIPTVDSSGSCVDPALSLDLSWDGTAQELPPGGLCSHSYAAGSVLHKNETFGLVWDPNPYSDYTAPYLEQFLRDVADGSGTLGSPYAVTAQYTDAGGRAGNASMYGGGYDYSTAYPSSGCTASGPWYYKSDANSYVDSTNDICISDAQLRGELNSMVEQNGLIGRIQPGYSPVLVLMTPPGVETCIDGAGVMCSANSATSGPGAHSEVQFCSYHSQINIDGTVFDYIVQPFTALTACDDPAAPTLPNPITPPQLETDMGARLVSPLSQAQIATIVDPGFSGWFAQNGDEINDDGCAPEATSNGGTPVTYTTLDSATLGSSGQNPYLLQREFNNGGVIENSPWAYQCTPNVDLGVTYVVPSAVDAGDVVQFDGSKSYSSLLIPNGNFSWTFGDGTGATGPSATHIYAKGGTYTVTLTVTDRGGDVDTLSQTVQVLGSNGAPVPPPTPPPAGSPALTVRLAMMPQSLKAVLRSGIALQVSSNSPANGIATVSISRAAAKRAHIKVGHGPSVRIGLGTVASIQDGTVNLRLHLSKATVAKLRRLGHVSLTVRLALVGPGGQHIAVDVAGRY